MYTLTYFQMSKFLEYSSAYITGISTYDYVHVVVSLDI